VHLGSKLPPSPIRRLNPRRPRPAAAIPDRSWRARRGVARVAITTGRCVGMVSVAYATRVSVAEGSKSAKENECVATGCMICAGMC
jgi:hypothetical protein